MSKKQDYTNSCVYAYGYSIRHPCRLFLLLNQSKTLDNIYDLMYNVIKKGGRQMGKQNKKRFKLLNLIAKLLFAVAALIKAIAELIDSLNH